MLSRQHLEIINLKRVSHTVLAGALLLAIGHVSAQAALQPSPHAPDYQISIATQLKEVQQGNIDGRDYLTLNIGGHEVGPSACRSNILRMEKGGNADLEAQEQIEATAIEAMLTRTTVMIVVPLDIHQCIDGKPTFTDLYKLPARS